MSINIAYYLFFIIEASLSGNIGTKLQKFVEPILPHYWNNVLQHWDKVVLHYNAFFIYIHYCFAIMHQCCLNIFLSMLSCCQKITNVMLLQLCKTIVGQHHRQWWRNVLSTQIATWVNAWNDTWTPIYPNYIFSSQFGTSGNEIGEAKTQFGKHKTESAKWSFNFANITSVFAKLIWKRYGSKVFKKDHVFRLKKPFILKANCSPSWNELIS